MKVLLVQPSRVEPDGSIYKNKTRWLLGMTLPYLAALTPPGVDVAIKDDLYEDITFDEPCDVVGLTCMSHQASRAYQIADEFRRRGKRVVLGGFHATLAPEESRDFSLHDLDLAETSIFEVLDRAQTPSLMAPFQVLFVHPLVCRRQGVIYVDPRGTPRGP